MAIQNPSIITLNYKSLNNISNNHGDNLVTTSDHITYLYFVNIKRLLQCKSNNTPYTPVLCFSGLPQDAVTFYYKHNPNYIGTDFYYNNSYTAIKNNSLNGALLFSKSLISDITFE